MKDLPISMEDLSIYSTVILGLAALLIIFKKVPRTKGVKVENHFIYVIFVSVTLYFCPDFIQNALFSPEGVVIVGTILPIYESIKAVVSIDDLDDVAWLQFWLISGEVLRSVIIIIILSPV